MDKIGTNNNPHRSAKIFAKNSDAIQPHAKSEFVVKSNGPGCNPHIINPPSRTDPVLEPGIPRASNGAKQAAHAALLADSQEAIPSMAPSPNGSSDLNNFFCVIYPTMDAVVAPAPGRMPTIVPNTPFLRHTGRILFHSCLVRKFFFTESFSPDTACPSFSVTKPMTCEKSYCSNNKWCKWKSS